VYTIDVTGNTPHTLVLASDRAFVPARVRRWSSDTRELSLMVTRLTWSRTCTRCPP